ncbi:guanine nucleotide-binding protein alpha-4 subunit-related [Anaeramoeba ignava]|uniref:Guanine nucleotide-binding protein alpha-4 subunit-related n=1 Tax=Anaeramoeba ignava TaxID=1746090 RepID=A0A9Q0LRI8_ANAIG|nr:guanine nucleotide-binding protein alpha-4 subunit-related [Anaeramoeba ignava]|eukprot:Anaeramoba_ignava/a478785_164.p1 GENE.a478785_164~~a478785_164.p1  ORF type:complete len:354 (+),score=114.92 a478785_164:38-1099(+)
MGNCEAETDGQDKGLQKRNKTINNLLKKQKNQIDKEKKLLLLGGGESGKSTIFKQMKLLQDGDFDKDQLDDAKPIVYINCLSQIQILIFAAEKLGIQIENVEIAENLKRISPEGTFWTKEIQQGIKTLWKDSGIKEIFKYRNRKFQLNDSAQYFFDNIDRFTLDFTPTKQDVLRLRVKTTGIHETEFRIHGVKFRLVDVGGQRNERKKWIHCFEGVTSVIFCVSLIEYAQTLREEAQVNRMTEALSLFREICTSPWFTKSSIVLFLNKKDLIDEQLKEVPLSSYFPDFNGYTTEEAIKFIEKKFFEISEIKDFDARPIFAFPTCAIDTENINSVAKSVIATVLKNDLDDLDMI